MQTLDSIYRRRSIRKFLHLSVSEENITEMLKAAMYAPSARNTQAWEFVVITNRIFLDKLSEIHPYAKMLKYAPLAILVCGNKKIEENEAYLNQNCAAATQNILLSAFALGLGSVWLGVYPKKERIDPISELLKLPENILPISLIAIGYPDEIKEIPQRFDLNKVHYNGKW